MVRNSITWGKQPVEFGFEREEHSERIVGLTVPYRVITVIGVITGLVVFEQVLYRF